MSLSRRDKRLKRPRVSIAIWTKLRNHKILKVRSQRDQGGLNHLKLLLISKMKKRGLRKMEKKQRLTSISIVDTKTQTLIVVVSEILGELIRTRIQTDSINMISIIDNMIHHTLGQSTKDGKPTDTKRKFLSITTKRKQLHMKSIFSLSGLWPRLRKNF